MKREIKFRAWDNENKCWYEPIHEAYKGNLWELVLNFAGQLDAHTLDSDKIHSSLVHESRFPGRYTVVQFTGLKDKNGKEIYEGDITFETGKGNKVIEYITEIAGFGYRSKTGIERISIYGNIFEVIGNIYENPELIK